MGQLKRHPLWHCLPQVSHNFFRQAKIKLFPSELPQNTVTQQVAAELSGRCGWGGQLGGVNWSSPAAVDPRVSPFIQTAINMHLVSIQIPPLIPSECWNMCVLIIMKHDLHFQVQG